MLACFNVEVVLLGASINIEFIKMLYINIKLNIKCFKDIIEILIHTY